MAEFQETITAGMGAADSIAAIGVFNHAVLADLGQDDSLVGSGVEISLTVTEAMGQAEVVAAAGEFNHSITDALGLADSSGSFNLTRWLEKNAHLVIRRYFLTIEDQAGGDITIPMASFQIRHDHQNKTYLEAVIPGQDMADEISARPNGELVVSMGWLVNGVLELEEELGRAAIDQVRLDGGGVNKSIILGGRSNANWPQSKKVTIEPNTNVYRSVVDGKILYRLAVPDLYLQPNDQVYYGAENFTVGEITLAVNSILSTITISEK